MSNQISFQTWLDLCITRDSDATPSSTDEVSARIRKDARTHFEALSSSAATSVSPSTPSATSSTVLQDISNASSTTANGALALLVSSLGPAFTSSANTDTKIRALFCLMGALEGCKDLTHGVRQAVGNFLLELCRPASSDDEEENNYDDVDQEMDYVDSANLTPDEITQQLQSMSAKRSKLGSASSLANDDVRDAAMASLKALLRSQLEIFPTQQSQTTSESNKPQCPITKALGVVYESMELRMELGMMGVRYRCQTGDESNNMSNDNNGGMWGAGGAGYETGDPQLNIEDGLSQLPRLKRSLCFDLLDGALDGLKADELKWKKLRSQLELKSSTIPTSLLKSMASFTSLSSSCMHGETDPRCLLQLLLLLNKVQQIMLPLFAPKCNDTGDKMDKDTSELMAFPSIEIFDAVAPYYPISFTPPKNDPHGITREMLEHALLAVLCERAANYSNQFMVKKNDGDDGEEMENMTMLAARMFMERLEPPKSSDYDPPSSGAESEIDDKWYAVRDLSVLLMNEPPFSNNEGSFVRVSPALLSELSSSMARVHEEAVSSDGKKLASAIRKFSSSLAHTMETHINKSFWEAYVVDILRHLTPTLGSAPQGMHGRASTAYFASLAAEGGLLTLNKVLSGCYPRFLGVLSLIDENDKNKESNNTGEVKSFRDEEKLAAAMRGIAALISSCRVAMQKWQSENEGVKVYPHPLTPYISATIQKIAFVLNESLDEDEMGPLSLASVAALESVLTAVDLGVLEEEDLASLQKSISSMSRIVLCEEKEVEKESTKLYQWKAACARVLGAVISLGLGAASTSYETMSTLANSLLPEMLKASATSPPRDGSSKMCRTRFDWIALAGACANGTSHVSEQIVSELLSSIIAALQYDQTDPRLSVMALSYIIRKGGPNVGSAFHSLSPSAPSSFDIIEQLCQAPYAGPSEAVERPQLQVGMSALQLPDSRAKDEEVAKYTIKRAASILPYLIPAYECPSSMVSCEGLVQIVDQVMPPLSEWDEVKLYVTLPLLAALLTSSHKVWKSLDSATLKTLSSMITYLAEFSISSDPDAQAKSAASACLFYILFHGSEDDKSDDDTLVIQKLLKEVMSPSLVNSLDCLKGKVSDIQTPRASSSAMEESEESLHSNFSQVDDTLNFIGLLGSAAACKGGSFAQTGDKIASFLIELACTGSSQFPFTETTIQLVTPSEQGQKHPLLDPASHVYILPATAFGSMLSVHNGGPFWRQRMTHKTLSILMKSLHMQAKSQNPPALGTLAVVCHMLCCLPSSLLGKSNVKQILPTLLAGLVYFSKNSNSMAQSESISTKPTDLLSVILAALVKILTVSPEDVTKFIGIIIPSLLLLSSPTESSASYIPKQVLVLQCIEIIANHPLARNSVLREKDQVITVLSAVVDHPSLIVRNAVVQARNVWCTLA